MIIKEVRGNSMGESEVKSPIPNVLGGLQIVRFLLPEVLSQFHV